MVWETGNNGPLDGHKKEQNIYKYFGRTATAANNTQASVGPCSMYGLHLLWKCRTMGDNAASDNIVVSYKPKPTMVKRLNRVHY